MSKLLHANFMRLRKSKAFWVGMIFMLVAGIVAPVSRYFTIQYYELEEGVLDSLEDHFFVYALLVSIVLSVVCSLFISTEYSDGTLRNKVVVGHTRKNIYLSNLITSTVIGLAMCIPFLAASLCVGIQLFGFFETDIETILFFVGCVFVMTMALSAIYTFIAMLNQNRAVVVATCILTAFILLFVGFSLYEKLSEPEMYPVRSHNEKGELVIIDEVPNPNAVSGTIRDVYEFLYDFLPSGQAMQCYTLNAEHPKRLILYSAIIIVTTTGCGMFFFRRKDLK